MRLYLRVGQLLVATALVTACSLSLPGASPTPASVGQAASTAAVATSMLAVVRTPIPEEDPTSTPAVSTVTPVPPTVSPATATASSGGVLQRVRQRGKLICGVNQGLPGFAVPNTAIPGDYIGFEADFCRVVATAVFGSPKAITFEPLSADERFRALALGEIDVLIRNTTWTAVRDTGLDDTQLGLIKLDFGPTIFHDGQRFMVRQSLRTTADQPVRTVEDLAGKRICVIENTTSELNLRDQMAARGIAYIPIIKSTADEVFTAYGADQCDAVTSDTSQLVGRRVTLSTPSEHIILDEPISREPLGPVVVENDSQWRDVVSWSIFATIYAEELGVDSTNAGQLVNAANPDIQRLLGSSGKIGINLGLKNDFALTIIQEVGNYEEIYQRNLGPNTPFNLDRGPNKAWNKGSGGVLSSPPFR